MGLVASCPFYNLSLFFVHGNRSLNVQAPFSLNTDFTNIGKSCAYKQSNSSRITDGYIPMDHLLYNDDSSLFINDGSGILIKKPGTYIVEAQFHVSSITGDTLYFFVEPSIETKGRVLPEILYTESFTQQRIVKITCILSTTAEDRVKLRFSSTTKESCVFTASESIANSIVVAKLK